MHQELFPDQRDYVIILCREAKREYYQEKIGDSCSDPQKHYKVMNELLHHDMILWSPPMIHGLPCPCLNQSSKDMANQFSCYFLSKMEKIRGDLDAIQVLSPLNNSKNTLPPESLLDFASVNDEIVSKRIRNSHVKSCSLDSPPTHVLKYKKHLMTYIANIVNKSMKTGTFPSYQICLSSPKF